MKWMFRVLGEPADRFDSAVDVSREICRVCCIKKLLILMAIINVSLRTYRASHMIYTHQDSLGDLRQDAGDFLEQALEQQNTKPGKDK
jgi:hypothetical protein